MKLGTRGSQLAMWQARAVSDWLERAGHPKPEIVIVRTTGDEAGTGLGPGGATLATRDADAIRGDARTRSAADGATFDASASVKRLFVKELEEALLDGRIDAAVHSSKDMPTSLPPGLTIAAALPREDPRDALLLPGPPAAGGDLDAVAVTLGARPRIGTSSVRRIAQLRAMFPHAIFADIRGNLDTRLRKLDAGDYDALVLAAAGLRRLGHADRISWAVPVERSVPAPGQGIVAVEIRADRSDLAALFGTIDDRDAADALAAERAVVHALGGGCQMPLGALAEIVDADLRVTAAVFAPDGSRVVRDVAEGPRGEGALVGVRLAEALLRRGAGAILDLARGQDRPVPEAAP